MNRTKQSYHTYQEIRDAVEEDGGLIVTTMEVLRDVHGVGKLGVHVRKGIDDRLGSMGLGHLPYELPSYQHEEVRIYRLGSEIAKVVEAVIRPSAEGDELLRSSLGTEAQRLLSQVRELVCA
jgi:hypothetical protein